MFSPSCPRSELWINTGIYYKWYRRHHEVKIPPEISGTRIGKTKVLKAKIPILHIRYAMEVRSGSLEKAIEKAL